MVVVLAGRRIDEPGAERPRFPLTNVEAVAERLQNVLADLKTEVLVSSAACGADLLALDAARTLGIRRRIVLPFDASSFRASSVVDRPGDWGPLFDLLYEVALSSNDVVILPCEGGDETAYAAATERIVAEALTLAKQPDLEGGRSPNGGPTAIVVWEGESRGEGDQTAKFVALAANSGMRVVEVATLGDLQGGGA
jgi:hypothetical protein